MRLDQLARILKAALVRGNPALEITGLANLKEAGPADLSHYSDARYASDLQATRAGAVLLRTLEGASLPPHTAALQTADPELGFVQALALLCPAERETPGVDPRAAIEDGVEIGAEAYVGPYAVVRKGAHIGARAAIHSHAFVGRRCSVGEDSILHPHAVLYDGVRLGRNVIVHSGTVLGADGFGYKFRDGRHVKVPQAGIVEIGDDVEIGANACIDRAALGATRIGGGTKIDNLVQVGHNVSVGRHCILCGQAAIAGSSGMDDYAILGGNAGIADHVFMGKGSKAGAKSGVGKDVPPGAEVFGIPADERKAAWKQLAALRRLPGLAEKVKALEKRLAELEGGRS